MGFALSDMKVTSSAFEPRGVIPAKHTGEGADVSPALAWRGAPQDAQSFAVFCHDPDAPLVRAGTYGFVHWVLYNLPADTDALEEGTGAGTAGANDFGGTGYKGPMPPEGHGVHHYYFWVAALDSPLDLPAGLTLEQFLGKAEAHLLAMNRLVGTYQRG